MKTNTLTIVLLCFVSLMACKQPVEKIKIRPWSTVLMQLDSHTVKTVFFHVKSSSTVESLNQIYFLQRSVKYFAWENPTSGGAVHINQHDEIEVYQATFGMRYLRSDIDKNGDSVSILRDLPKDSFFVVKKHELHHNISGIGYGNPTSVLITSEIDPKESKAFAETLDVLANFDVYYLQRVKECFPTSIR